MIWQVDCIFEMAGRDRVKQVRVRVRPKRLRWWWPPDWLLRARGFEVTVPPCAGLYQLVEDGRGLPVGRTVSIIEPARELEPGTAILAPEGNWNWHDAETVRIELPEGGELVLPGDRTEPAEDPAD